MSEIDQEMLQDYLDEASEHIENINTSLLELENNPGNKEVINSLFRSAHTIKGMSGMMSFTRTNELTHSMENLLDDIRNDIIALNSEITDVLFSCLDSLQKLIEGSRSGAEPESDITSQIEKLKSIKESGGVSPAPSLQKNSKKTKDAEIDKKVEEKIKQLKAEELEEIKNLHLPPQIELTDAEISLTKEAAARATDFIYLLKLKMEKDINSKKKNVIAVFNKINSEGIVIYSGALLPEKIEDVDEFDMEFAVLFSSTLALDELSAKTAIEKEKISALKNASDDGTFQTEEILKSFYDEAEELVDSLSNSVFELEQKGFDDEIIATAFRAAHTLKGLSNMLGFNFLGGYVHKVENILDSIRNKKLELYPEIIDILMRAATVVENKVGEIVQTGRVSSDLFKEYDKIDDIMKVYAFAENEAIISRTGYNLPQSIIYFLDAAVKDKLKEAALSGKKLYLKKIKYGKDLASKTENIEVLTEKAGLFGENIMIYPEVDKEYSISEMEVDKLELVLNYILASDESPEMMAIALECAPEDLEVFDPIEEQEIKPATVLTSAPSAVKIAAASDSEDSLKTAAPVKTTTLRVDIEKLDSLMNLIGEIVIGKTQVEELAKTITAECHNEDLGGKLISSIEDIGRIINDLQEGIMKTRMVPVGTVFNKFPRVVRDLARSRDKNINLVIDGAETELDKTVIEEIGDPLIHLIRNAADHGIELPEIRLSKGKTETGTVRLNAFHEGNHIIIEVEEDGAGINPEILKKKAVEKGMMTEEEVSKLTKKEALNLIFGAGFSTAEKITDISGRGVGMDVVRSNISKINGIIDIESEIDKGTKITIKLPLTLAIIRGLLVKVSGEVFAVPLASVIESVSIKRSKIKKVQNESEIIELRGEVMPVLRLNNIFKISPSKEEKENCYLVIVGLAESKAAIMVDSLVTQQEIVIKSMTSNLVKTSSIAGATILGNGKVVLILDIENLIELAKKKE